MVGILRLFLLLCPLPAFATSAIAEIFSAAESNQIPKNSTGTYVFTRSASETPIEYKVFLTFKDKDHFHAIFEEPRWEKDREILRSGQTVWTYVPLRFRAVRIVEPQSLTSAAELKVLETKMVDHIPDRRFVVDQLGKTSTDLDRKFRYRSYLMNSAYIEQLKGTSSNKVFSEFGFSADYKFDWEYSSFLDAILTYKNPHGIYLPILNQGGVRYQPSEKLVFAVGKERNRRGPAVVYSPSEWLVTEPDFPGSREDHRGLWLARASYQEEKSSYELIALPVDNMTPEGLPGKNVFYQGTLLRTFRQYENLDFTLTLGKISDITRGGLAAQYIVNRDWKTYYELGYDEQYETLIYSTHTQSSQHLLGFSYEGIDRYAFKLEYFFNGRGLSAGEYQDFRASPEARYVFLMRRQYAIFSFTASEMLNRWNFYFTPVKSLEDSAYLAHTRLEYILNGNFVAGLAAMIIGGGDDSQYSFRPYDRTIALDLKYTL